MVSVRATPVLCSLPCDRINCSKCEIESHLLGATPKDVVHRQFTTDKNVMYAIERGRGLFCAPTNPTGSTAAWIIPVYLYSSAIRRHRHRFLLSTHFVNSWRMSSNFPTNHLMIFLFVFFLLVCLHERYLQWTWSIIRLLTVGGTPLAAMQR